MCVIATEYHVSRALYTQATSGHTIADANPFPARGRERDTHTFGDANQNDGPVLKSKGLFCKRTL